MIIDFLKKRKLLLLVLIFSLVGLLLRLLFIWEHSTAFTYDQGRDMLDLREMWLLKKPRLIGANTSLHGVFYGPFWYWLSFPFFLLTGGHPLSTLILLLVFSFLMPFLFFLLVENKHLGFVLSLIYLFSFSFFSHSIVALNTNPIIFLTPLFLLLAAKFYKKEKMIFLSLLSFLVASSFHFEPIIGLFWILTIAVSWFIFGKVSLVWKNKQALVFFLIPFLPQAIFEFRHNFLQTKALWRLLSGGGSSLTPGGGGLVFRFFDRIRIFKEAWLSQSGNNLIMAGLILALILLLISKFMKKKNIKKEEDYFILLCLISLTVVFFGFVIYSYALWPWYLSTVDALILTLIGLGIYFLGSWGKKYIFLSMAILAIFLFFSFRRYFSWPIQKYYSSDPANLRTRIQVADLIYDDAKGGGINIFTFAPYVYDYPYQYLIWWRAKTKYQYLPEEYVYLLNQPKYVAAKDEADQIIPGKKSECDYLIIEPFESQEKWFWEWRGHFPKSQKTWTIGLTRVEKLCQ